MDYGIRPVTWTRTCECGATVTVTTQGTGPVGMCETCADALRSFIFGGGPMSTTVITAIFPLQDASPVKCGNRRDLPKAQRRHRYIYLGTDPRHMNDGSFASLHVYACAMCGADKQTSRPPA